MYIHNSFLNAGSAQFVSVNATNEFMATANMDGNISVRSIPAIRDQYLGKIPGKLIPTEPNDNKTHPYTIPQLQINEAPADLEPALQANAQKVLNTVGVRSRSKVTSLRYANMLSNANLLAAVYKNGEAYILSNPHDATKCRIQQIFKHAKGLILDFSWSADDQLMAFTSMNNEVIIYDVIYGRIISNLHIHENTEVFKDGATEEVSIPVKGVTFDKCQNNFLLTLGDDRVMNVIRYKLVDDEILGRKFEYKIVKVFDNIINSAKLNKATIKKIAVSPDDKFISCPNTSKNRTMRIALIEKVQNMVNNDDESNWTISNELLAYGYKSYMTLFSPNVYKNAQGNLFYVLASLSTDSVLSIWRTDMDIPVYAVPKIAPAITDFSWSGDGSLIFLTPQTGSMSVVVFQHDQFGPIVYTANKLVAQLQKRTNEILPFEFKKLEDWKKFEQNYPQIVRQKEQEVFDNELKKVRIKPLDYRPPRLEVTPSDSPNPWLASTPSSVPIEQKNGNGNVSAEKKQTPKQQPVEKEKNNKPTIEVRLPAETKPVEIPKDIPAPLAQTKEKEKTKDKPTTTPALKASKKDKEPSVKPTPVVENTKKRTLNTSNYDLPSNSVPKDLNAKVVKMMKKDLNQSTSNANAQTTKKKRDVEPVEFVGSVIINPQLSFSNIRIAIPKLRMNISYRLPDDKSLNLIIKNGNGFESQPTRISLSKEISKLDSKQIFIDFLPHKIHNVCGSTKYWALSTSTGQILTYTESGRRVLPALVLGSPLSFLEMKDQFLLAVTCTGELYVWDLNLKKSIFKPISLYPLLQPIYSSGQALSTNQAASSSNPAENGGDVNANVNVNIEANSLVFVNGELLTRSENLTMCSVTSQGIPIVTLSNGNGYLFNKDMNAWSLISDSWWAFGSQYWDSSMSIENLKSVGLLEYMESHTNEEIIRRGKAKFFTKISKMMLMREGYENLETTISLNHLENKINFYLYLKDYENYKTFLIIYAKRLSELNLKNRLLEILQSLFVDRNGEICGHPKKKLLEELILSCSKHREVQHILVQYSESIGLLPQGNDSDNDIL